MTTKDISFAVASEFDYIKNIIIPNVFISPQHECDLLIITKAGYCTEVEIKVSKADMIKDLSKPHNHNNEKLKFLYYAFSIEIFEECKNFVPEHAGLIKVVDNKGYFKAIFERNAIQKPCKKLTTEEILSLARLGCIRNWTK